MVNVYLSPRWFSGYDILFELIFAFILLSIAFFAFKLHNKTDQRSIRLFGIAFSLMSFSYFIQSVFNLIMLVQNDPTLPRGVYLRSIASINTYALISHIILMTLGLIILLYSTKKERKVRDPIIFSLLSIAIIFISPAPLLIFNLISALLLIFIEVHFIKNYYRYRDKRALFIIIAFPLILLASIAFIFSLYHKLYYVISHLLLCAAYSLILINFFKIKKNVKKKRTIRNNL